MLLATGGSLYSDVAAKSANAFEWPGQPPEIAPSTWGLCTSLGPPVFIQNGMSFGSAVFAQCTVECPITLQWAATFSLTNCSFPLGDWVPHLTHGTRTHPSHQPQWHLDLFSRFCTGPKCYAVHCIVSGEKNPKIAPSPWDFVTSDGGGPSHSHRQHTQKVGKDHACGSGQTDMCLWTHRRAHYNTLPPLPQVK